MNTVNLSPSPTSRHSVSLLPDPTPRADKTPYPLSPSCRHTDAGSLRRRLRQGSSETTRTSFGRYTAPLPTPDGKPWSSKVSRCRYTVPPLLLIVRKVNSSKSTFNTLFVNSIRTSKTKKNLGSLLKKLDQNQHESYTNMN